MPDQIKWPRGTPQHIRTPIPPRCTDCGTRMPAGDEHDCPTAPAPVQEPAR